MNANIRRAAMSITAAAALTLVGGGSALADEASFEQDRSFEGASAGPNGPTAGDYENNYDGQTSTTDGDEDGETMTTVASSNSSKWATSAEERVPVTSTG